MMKDYSGILICTDYDGTLAWDGVCQKNIDAICEFMAHGGKFTLATGRANYEVCENDLPVKPNAPLVCMIGSRIYDFTAQKSLADYPMAKKCKETVRKAAIRLSGLASASVYSGTKTTPLVLDSIEKIDEGLRDFGDDVYKVVFWLKENYTQPLFDEVKILCGEVCNLCSNREDILELTAAGVHKGTAVLRLKEMLGAKLLVCAGDFNGDIPMLRAADIGYAVENASDEVKAAADRVTVHAKDGALAQIIADLDGLSGR